MKLNLDLLENVNNYLYPLFYYNFKLPFKQIYCPVTLKSVSFGLQKHKVYKLYKIKLGKVLKLIMYIKNLLNLDLQRIIFIMKKQNYMKKQNHLMYLKKT